MRWWRSTSHRRSIIHIPFFDHVSVIVWQLGMLHACSQIGGTRWSSITACSSSSSSLQPPPNYWLCWLSHHLLFSCRHLCLLAHCYCLFMYIFWRMQTVIETNEMSQRFSMVSGKMAASYCAIINKDTKRKKERDSLLFVWNIPRLHLRLWVGVEWWCA